MHKSIDKLIRKYQERNKTLLNKNPRIGIEFDWSPESFEYAHNEGFIRDLRKILD